MGWKLLHAPKSVPMTRKLANEFANMEHAKQERTLRQSRLEAYERLRSMGMFRPCTWSRAFCAEDGKTYRVNGQHTSTMYSMAPEIESGQHVVVEEYHCDTLEDVSQLWATFDAKLSTRSQGDINRSFAASVPELASIPSDVISLVVSGINFRRHLEAYTNLSPAERAEVLLEKPEFAIWVHDLLGSRKNGHKHMARSAVVAAMFGSYEKTAKGATEFWTEVRDASGVSPRLPSRVIEKYLLANYLRNGETRPAVAKRKAGSREFYVKCIHAWNAWRDGSNTDLKYHADKPPPAFR